MKKLWSLILATSMTFAFASPDIFLTMDKGEFQEVIKANPKLQLVKEKNGLVVATIPQNEVARLSTTTHQLFHKCGGFFAHETLEEAEVALSFNNSESNFLSFVDYSLTEHDYVKSIINEVQEREITSTITKLSSFHNRYYRATTGVDSQKWVAAKWQGYAGMRSDAKVELYKHSRWPQPSVVMTIEGSEVPEDVIVIGGHGDSIAGFWNRGAARAPGADDNASGIATLTEAMRVLLANGFKPKRTIKFMSYAAEEVGLLGSNEIAQEFKRNGINVVGVLQLDMTNVNGSDIDIVMMSDYTNQSQNEFLGMLIDEYVKVPWGYSKCGYGCSDHASWHKAGYPASIPFESRMGDINRKIHTAQDTLAVSGGHSNHAVKFAKLALAYIVELAQK